MRPLAGLGGPPLTPDGDTARRWVTGELSQPEYAAARPSWFDLLSQKIADWFGSLHVGGGHGTSAWLAAIGAAIVLGILVLAVLRFGLPRLNRRARSVLLGGEVDDTRTPEQLRAAAERAASAGDWPLAVIERFRAIAASLAERTVIVLRPGTTAHEVALQAVVAFSGEATGLRDAADTFDAARYLGHAQHAEAYERLRALDERLRRASPVFVEAAG